MIEDSGKLIHLWARWWGTFCMCECLREKCLSAFMYMWASVCVPKCHRCRTRCEMGPAWKRPERYGATPTGGPCLFTVHLSRQPKIFIISPPQPAHYILIWPSSEQSETCRIANLSAVVLSDCLAVQRTALALVRHQILEVSADVMKVHFNLFVFSAQQILCKTSVIGHI